MKPPPPEVTRWARRLRAAAACRLPEPPDRTIIEFEYHTDVYAAWRSDASAAAAGYPTGDGGAGN